MLYELDCVKFPRQILHDKVFLKTTLLISWMIQVSSSRSWHFVTATSAIDPPVPAENKHGSKKKSGTTPNYGPTLSSNHDFIKSLTLKKSTIQNQCLGS